MSWSISTYVIVDDMELPCQDAGNCTWNVAPMFYAALQKSGYAVNSLSKNWDMQKARDILPQVEAIIRQMELEPETYKAMNPENGWGDYYSAIGFMRDLREAILKSPESAILSLN